MYAHHHPAAIGLPYPPRPGSGSGLRPKPFIAKGILGPVPTSDAVPDVEKREFEAQATVIEVHHEGVRQGQGQGQEEGPKTTTSAGDYYALDIMDIFSYNATTCLVAQDGMGRHVILWDVMWDGVT